MKVSGQSAASFIGAALFILPAEHGDNVYGAGKMFQKMEKGSPEVPDQRIDFGGILPPDPLE